MKKNKMLVIVDFQNDFITGSLGFKEAESLVDGIKEKAQEYINNNYPIICTLDMHSDVTYMNTREGKNLPIKHCILNSKGADLQLDLSKTLFNYDNVTYLCKYDTFGLNFDALSKIGTKFLKDFDNTEAEIEIVGLVTNLCVLSNAVALQSTFPDANIVIDASLCASNDKSMHDKALDIMEGLQMTIKNR